MAHSTQARKRIRQTEKRNAANTAMRTRIRTFVKRAEEAIKSGDKALIGNAFTAAMSELAKGARKGIVTKNAAARKVSRLAKRIAG